MVPIVSDDVKVSFKIERLTIEELMTVARKADRTLSAEMRIAIREHIRKAKENGNGNA